jgi:thiamine-monophosphate kinase
MVDVSDGLVADLGHLASSSSVSISIDADAVPIEPGVEAVAGATGRDLVGFALSGGEDYELAMTVDPEQLEALVEMVESKGFTLSVIGRVGDGAGVEITSAGRPIEPPPGFEHSF